MKNNTINIAICDDEQHTLMEMKRIIDKYMKLINIEYNLHVFDNPLNLLEEKYIIHILFLDVEMPQMDGFAVAEKIREKNKDIKIIFVTSHSELVQKAFKVKAFRYLYKGCNEYDIKEVIEDAVKELQEYRSILVEYQGKRRHIRIKDIYWIESLGDTTAVHLNNEDVITNKILKQWKEELDDSFFQCHKSYLINLDWIKVVSNEGAVLENGVFIPVSARNRSTLKKEFHEFIKRNARYI